MWVLARQGLRLRPWRVETFLKAEVPCRPPLRSFCNKPAVWSGRRFLNAESNPNPWLSVALRPTRFFSWLRQHASRVRLSTGHVLRRCPPYRPRARAVRNGRWRGVAGAHSVRPCKLFVIWINQHGIYTVSELRFIDPGHRELQTSVGRRLFSCFLDFGVQLTMLVTALEKP